MAKKIRKAAISLESLANKQLNQITAEDFLNALGRGSVPLSTLCVWPEKKKRELWEEMPPECPPRSRVGDVIRRIRSEKKKVELEPMPMRPGDSTLDPIHIMTELAQRVANLEMSLKRKRR